MKIIDLEESGDPVDPDLVSLLAGEGVDTLEEVMALGRPHFVALFADRAGFTRDFVTILEELGLTWETAASAERLQCSVDEMEIGIPALVVAERLGAETFADVYNNPSEVVQAAMAERDGMLAELDDLMARTRAETLAALLAEADRFRVLWRDRDVALVAAPRAEPGVEGVTFAEDRSGGAFRWIDGEDARSGVWLHTSEGQEHRLAEDIRSFLERLAEGYTVGDLISGGASPSEHEAAGALRWIRAKW